MLKVKLKIYLTFIVHVWPHKTKSSSFEACDLSWWSRDKLGQGHSCMLLAVKAQAFMVLMHSKLKLVNLNIELL